jgi:CheY-like chemotaxis protein/nitrogen-specific signal transduction histidine kinase
MQRDDRSEAMGLFGVVRDVTEVVTIENQLVAMRDRAEAEARAKSEFLATMSHEIRTPMTGVLGLIELLGTNPAEEDRDRYLCAMVQSAELLMSVLDGILDFSKAEAGMLELRLESFNLEALVRRTVEMFENSTSKKGLSIEVLFPSNVSQFVIGDPIRLQQILINLISNAVKFTENGGVTVMVQAQPATRDAHVWRVEVQDTGVGISGLKLNSVFEPFVQVGLQHSGGTGLGLAICRRLIEVMQGRTGVHSTPGSGSTFWFEVELPIGAASVLEQPRVREDSDDTLSVLLAEDNRINQMIIAALLKGLGHRVTCVANGKEAVHAAGDQRFDCIFMDMQMPEMDGIAATHAIRTSAGPNASSAIIALTADAAPERRRFYENVGLSGFLTKPVTREALQHQLATLSTPAEANRPAIDPQRLSELNSALGAEQTNSVLAVLAAELPGWIKALRVAIEQGSLEEALQRAHDLKGAAANIGAEAVAYAARGVERAALGPDAKQAMRKLERAADAVILSIHDLTAGNKLAIRA